MKSVKLSNGRVKWGVIGSGGIARRKTIPQGILQADNAVLISVYDINRDVNVKVAQDFGAHAVDSIDELLGTDIDAVYIATPVDLHRIQTLSCATAGKHVLCEKPLAMNVSQAESMISACRSADVVFGTAFMMRFHCQHQAALKIIENGQLGKPVYARAQAVGWYPPMAGAWRQNLNQSGGGALSDMGSHLIDLLSMFFGPIKKVSCFINNVVQNYESEDSAIATLFFENGAIASIDTFFCIPDKCCGNALELYGSQGSIIANGTTGQDFIGEMRVIASNKRPCSDPQDSDMAEFSITPSPISTYCAMIEEFGLAVMENREPVNSGGIGLMCQKVLGACYESADKGTVVEIV